MEELKPCRCGGEVELKFDSTLNSWYVQCVDCLQITPGVKIGVEYEDAIKTWNRRADDGTQNNNSV
jgi:hypothetical protein